MYIAGIPTFCLCIAVGLVYRVVACLAGVKPGCVHLCHVASNTVCINTASDTPQL